uniref:Lipoxygenase n=1 Tax=Arachis hypogaea TaxID=3818 RepID=Q4JME6_ARAHY|nr:13-lipoxygenase [Arachis hypogaea]
MFSGVAGILNRGHKIKGTVVLMRKNVLDVDTFTDVAATANIGGLIGTGINVIGSTVDALTAFLGRSVSLQLISSTQSDENGNGKVVKDTFLEGIIASLPTLGAGESAFSIHFEWDDSMGIPGAFYIKNYMQVEFFLKTLTLEDVPNQGTIHFVCNSWVYNSKLYKSPRIFFSNKPYLPSETPAPLVKYREEDLKILRGDGKGERQEHERIYDYDVYNDLGNPDRNENHARPILGGSTTFPYPRRGRTGRYPARNDPNSEKPGDVYVPRDENFGHLKSSDFLANSIKFLTRYVLPAFESVFDLNLTPNEFDSFQDVRDLYEGGIRLPTEVISTISPLPVIKELFRTDGEQVLKFPPPHIIQVNKSAWMTDEEFAREMIAGVNPCMIRSLQEFPPKSNLDPTIYGDQNSKIPAEVLDLEGCSLEEAINGRRLFILDYHDVFMPYVRRINETHAKAYATRTILFLKEDGTLKPVAIELSLPHPDGDKSGAISEVILPAKEGVESTIWLLAKAYVIVNDSCYHQLMSHWLNTHAVIEPFVIATNRQLSVIHPIYKLLSPHYLDTMNINALARQNLINSDGIIERTFLPSKFSVEMSSAVYKNWVFTDQALPADLIKRGMAVEDSSSPYGIRLVIEDYPYAVDGLEIWFAIKEWVQDYVSLYYPTDNDLKKDPELQNWWKEAVEVGHGDLKDKPWWPKMQTVEELVESCTTIIWTASALHAAVNFGQYPYGGLILNRPTLSRRLLPEQGTAEYEEMVKSHQKAYLRTITPKLETLIDLTTIEILSKHASDEVYLGERDNPHWTFDSRALEAFQRFGNKLSEIEEKLTEKNKDGRLSNRIGPVELPYTLLHPTSNEGLTFRGVPNSISI